MDMFACLELGIWSCEVVELGREVVRDEKELTVQ